MPRSIASARIAVGCGDHPDVGLDGPRPAEPLELALLEDAKELGLHRQAHLADLVEEEHAAGRLLDLPGRDACAPVNAPRS